VESRAEFHINVGISRPVEMLMNKEMENPDGPCG